MQLHRSRRLSLRSRLLLGLIVLTAVGLGVAGSVVYGQIRSYLVGQVNTQLVEEAGSIHIECVDHGLPPGGWVFAYAPSSGPAQELCSQRTPLTGSSAEPPLPDITSSLVGGALAAGANGNGVIASTGSTSGTPYEAYGLAAQTSDGSTIVIVVALPLSGVDATMHRLLLIDLAVSLAVLALLAALGYAVVRVGLRPLEAIEETAGKIAAGDLTRRVERDEPETEIGRLGASLNAMLAQIEQSFAAQQASEWRMRQFVADAAHELRTPLTSIRGYAELFRRGAATRPDDLERSMRRIEDEAGRMGVLVDDLLLLARLDQGRPLEQRRVDLSVIAADAAADAQAVQIERPVSFESSGSVVVIGDEARLRQVVSNLVQNALVHTPVGTPVWISVRAEGDLAVLEVADAGPGIAAEHAARIFERFYRADSSRARNSGGTGLGLAIVASLAEAHGGRASVQTAPGSGARFRVELPLAIAGEETTPPRAANGSRDAAALAGREQETPAQDASNVATTGAGGTSLSGDNVANGDHATSSERAEDAQRVV